jgi:hypothetical protein
MPSEAECGPIKPTGGVNSLGTVEIHPPDPTVRIVMQGWPIGTWSLSSGPIAMNFQPWASSFGRLS